MIDYTPFWNILEHSDESWYTLMKRHGISNGTLSCLKNKRLISLRSIDDLCRILNCQIEDIIQYVPSDINQPLKNDHIV